MKIKELELTKSDSNSLDYKKLTFKDFIIIQNKAQEVANNIGYPVYLVGSALTKHNPRDIDISIIIPYQEYIEKYDINEEIHNADYCLYISFHKSFEDIKTLHSLVFDDYNIDLKICPDNWWVKKEKMLLAKPTKVDINDEMNLQELIDKQKPMKIGKEIYNNWNVQIGWECPQCGKKIEGKGFFCDSCGQKLDWSD